jgi:hypothetical protein
LEALFAALVGGFVGALVTGVLSAWHEHRRDRRALRVAARLVAAELRAIEARLHQTVASGTWRELTARSLAHGEWDEHRGSFAASYSLDRWANLDSAYRLVGTVNAAAAPRDESERLTELDRELLDSAARAVRSAAALLESEAAPHDDGPKKPSAALQRLLLRHP